MKILKGCVWAGGGGGGDFVRVFGGFQKWVRSMGGGKIWL